MRRRRFCVDLHISGATPGATARLQSATLRPFLAIAFAVVAALASANAVSAAEPADTRPALWREVWLGADVTSQSWLIYSGVTVSPWSGIHDDGIRFRFAAGYGRYRWEGAKKTASGALPRGVGRFQYADGLVGYLKRWGPLTAKAFVGVSLIDHDNSGAMAAHDAGFAPIHGEEVGLKTAVELWLNLGARAWSSLDLNWTSAHDTYSARLRAAWRAWPTVSLGVEAILNGDSRHEISRLVAAPSLEHVNRRAGLFVRYEWFGGEVSLAGGVSESPDEGVRPYATLNWITQF